MDICNNLDGPQGIMLSRKVQSQKPKYCLILFMQHFWNDTTSEMEACWVVTTVRVIQRATQEYKDPLEFFSGLQ